VSGVRIDIDLAELDVGGEIAALVADYASDKGLFLVLGRAMRTITQDRFEDQTAPDGTSWEKSQRAVEQSGQTLVDNSDLIDSLVTEQPLVLPGQATIGSNLPYAAIHNFGGETGRNKSVDMPKREYIGLNDNDSEELAEAAMRYIRRRG